jgi:heme/copper-type cytochrome/quinol oxidase subunit 2
MVSAVALIVAAIVSVMVASSYGINANELLDFTNWAVVFLAIEALVFLLATKFLTSWIHRERRSEEPMAK